MQNQRRSGFLLPPHPDVSERTYHRVLARLAAEEQLRTKHLIKRSERVAAVTAEYRGFVDALMGKGKTKPEALAALNHRFQTRMQKAARLPETRIANQGRVVALKDVPAPIRKYKTNPWTIRRPPFDGYNWSFSLTATGEVLTYIDQGGVHPVGPIWFDPASGRVGSNTNVLGDVRLNHNYVVRGHDEDIAAVNVRTYSSVGFWYWMDRATLHEARRGGQLEVWIEAQADATKHRIDLDPYSGWSTAWVDQNNFITLRATGEGDAEVPLDLGNQALVSRLIAHTSGGPLNTASETHLNTSFFEVGATCWTHQFSSNSFSANQPMWIQIGMQTVMDVSVGQVLTDSDMQFDWVIKSVQLRARRPD